MQVKAETQEPTTTVVDKVVTEAARDESDSTEILYTSSFSSLYEFEKTLGRGVYGVVRSGRRRSPEVGEGVPLPEEKRDHDQKKSLVACKIVDQTADYLREVFHLTTLQGCRGVLPWNRAVFTNKRVLLEFPIGSSFADVVDNAKFPDLLSRLKYCLWVAENLLRAIDSIHSRGIMHRDLTPANVLLLSKEEDARACPQQQPSLSSLPSKAEEVGQQQEHRVSFSQQQEASDREENPSMTEQDWLDKDLVLIDFGFSKKIVSLGGSSVVTATEPPSTTTTDSSSSSDHVVQPDYQVCSCQYRAPELFRMFKPAKYGPKVDEWSVGCIVYECFTGELPFSTDDNKEHNTRAKIGSFVWFCTGVKPACSGKQPLDVEYLLQKSFDSLLRKELSSGSENKAARQMQQGSGPKTKDDRSKQTTCAPRNSPVPATLQRKPPKSKRATTESKRKADDKRQQCTDLFNKLAEVLQRLLQPRPSQRWDARRVLSVFFTPPRPDASVAKLSQATPIRPSVLPVPSVAERWLTAAEADKASNVMWEVYHIFDKSEKTPGVGLARLFYQAIDKFCFALEHGEWSDQRSLAFACCRVVAGYHGFCDEIVDDILHSECCDKEEQRLGTRVLVQLVDYLAHRRVLPETFIYLDPVEYSWTASRLLWRSTAKKTPPQQVQSKAPVTSSRLIQQTRAAASAIIKSQDKQQKRLCWTKTYSHGYLTDWDTKREKLKLTNIVAKFVHSHENTKEKKKAK